MELREAVPLGTLYNPHQYDSVSAGQKKTIFYFKVPSGMVLFVKQVANTWDNNTYWLFEIDGERVYPKIERVIAELDEPKEYDPPFLVKGNVKWTFYNNSSSTVSAEVLCDGILYRISKPEVL